MYDHNYEQMVTASVAIKLDAPMFMDKEGNKVSNSKEAFGRATQYKITHPELIVMVDECGCNTNQTSDGNVGGQQFILPVNMTNGAGLQGSVVDMHFTVVPFTSGTGEAIMCAVILKSERDISEIPLTWISGIDVLHPNFDEGDPGLECDMYGEGKAMQG